MPKYFGGGNGGGSDEISLVNENSQDLGLIQSIKFLWLLVTRAGTQGRASLHSRMPRMRIRAATNSNSSTSTISTSFDGLSGSQGLRPNDTIWLGNQTIASECGAYRVWNVTGSVASIVKLSLIDSYFADGIYVQVEEGATAGGSILKFLQEGKISQSILMPSITATFLNFAVVPIEDFVLSGDNTNKVTGNWSPIIRRAQEAMSHVGGTLTFFFQQVYRCTERINTWTLTTFLSNHNWQSTSSVTHSPRILFDGCAGWFGPVANETYDGVTYDSGVRGGIFLENICSVFANGSSDNHYGALCHGAALLKSSSFFSPFGKGVQFDTTGIVGGIGNCNGDVAEDCLVQSSGLSAYWISGGDANNIRLTSCRATNYGTRGVEGIQYGGTAPNPGDDWGLYNGSFLGCVIDCCEFSSGSAGGIYDQGSFSQYNKPYTEGGTSSDVKTANVIGGNLTLRPGATSTRLPKFENGVGSIWTMSGGVTDDGSGRFSFGEAGIYRIGLSGGAFNYIGSVGVGGNTGLILEGTSLTNTSADRFRTLRTFASLGESCQGFRRGVWIGAPNVDAMRLLYVGDAAIPNTGVPLTASPASNYDGPYTLGSVVFAKPTEYPARLFRRVIANSGTPSYNLTWQAVANFSAPIVALTDSDQTLTVSNGGQFIQSVPITANRVKTLSISNARQGDKMIFNIPSQAFSITITNAGPGGGSKVLASGSEYRADYQFDGTNWIGQAWSCL